MTRSWQVYETNLVFDETIQRWQDAGLEVRYDAEDTSSTPGIAKVYRNGTNICHLGRKGRVQLYFHSVEDQEANLSLLMSTGAYPLGEAPLWVPTPKKKIWPSYLLDLENHSLQSANHSLKVDVIQERLRDEWAIYGKTLRKGMQRPPWETICTHEAPREPIDPMTIEATWRLVKEYYERQGKQPPDPITQGILDMSFHHGRDTPRDMLLAKLSKMPEKNADTSERLRRLQLRAQNLLSRFVTCDGKRHF